MKTIKFKAIQIAAMLALFGGGIANAQTVRLTLKDALSYAVENNSTARKARLDIEGGRAKVQEVRAQALPQISGNGSLTYNPIVGQLVTDFGTFEMGRAWNSAVGVQLNQELFNQQVFTGLRAARASEKYYDLNASLTEEQVIEQVSNNYYQVLVNRRQLAVIDTNIKNANRTQGIISAQFKAGLAKKIDLDRVVVNIANLNTQREQLANAIVLQENALKFSMGMPVAVQLDIPEIELGDIGSVTQMPDSVNTANRVEYQLLKTQENLLDLQRKAYQAEYYPSLSLNSNYSYTGQSSKFDLYRNGNAFWYDAAAVGVTLRIPVFNGFSTKAKIRQANVDLMKNREDIRNTSQSLNVAFENAKIQIRNSINTINSQRENVRLAQEIYNSTQNNYNNGLASLTDLLDAENALTSAQSNYSQALLNYKVAEIQLIKSNGNIKSLLNR